MPTQFSVIYCTKMLLEGCVPEAGWKINPSDQRAQLDVPLDAMPLSAVLQIYASRQFAQVGLASCCGGGRGDRGRRLPGPRRPAGQPAQQA